MTKTELEQKIKNGESVWFIFYGTFGMEDEIMKLDLKKDYTIKDNYLFNGNEMVFPAILSSLYKTKAEAEHYLHHANVSRIEQLPFLTWKEFKEKEYIEFYNDKKYFRLYISYINCDHIRISTYSKYNTYGDVIFEMPLTETNFYKAYDECVKLFRGE